MTSLEWFWPMAGLMEEGTRWFDRALAEPVEPSAALLPASTARACLAGQRNDVPACAQLARRAVQLPVAERSAARPGGAAPSAGAAGEHHR